VRFTVEFNNQPMLNAREVSKEQSDWMLATKLVPVEPTIVQLRPKQCFSLRGISS
jgi:hypothetical protein